MRISLLNIKFLCVIITIKVVMLIYSILSRQPIIVIMLVLHLIYIKNVVKEKWEIYLFHLIPVIIIIKVGDL